MAVDSETYMAVCKEVNKLRERLDGKTEQSVRLACECERLKEKVAELEARAGESTELLNEHFIEWELDSGSWNEFAWHEKVANFLDVPCTGWLLRKQAEAVEQLVSMENYALWYNREFVRVADIETEAQHLRQQADEAEKAGGER